MTPQEKRKKIEAHILQVMKLAEPKTLINYNRYKEKFTKMSDQDFAEWMDNLDKGNIQVEIYSANMKNPLTTNDLFTAADYVGVEVMKRISIWDNAAKRYYTPKHAYPVLELPARRLKQYLEDKRSVPEGDSKLDAFTGQVVRPDKGSSVSPVEMQTYVQKGLHKSVIELMNIRGGNTEMYAAYKGALEESGNASLSELDVTSRARSVDVLKAYLAASHIENNL